MSISECIERLLAPETLEEFILYDGEYNDWREMIKTYIKWDEEKGNKCAYTVDEIHYYIMGYVKGKNT